MVRVCDAIMGTGKSQSAISYMNAHSDRKFIYITPYLDEATRIKENCPTLHFVEPSDKIPECHYLKSLHTVKLINEGRNITTTHQSFKFYTASTLEDIRRKGYTLIIDENVDVLEEFNLSLGDLQMAIDAGYVEVRDDRYVLVDDCYEGKALSELFRLLRSRDLFKIVNRKKKEEYYFWALPPELITSFSDVIILTYLFEGQSLYHFLRMHNIPYKYIGVERDDDGVFHFSENGGYIPDYVSRLSSMISIVDKPKLNQIGDDYHALSISWFEKHPNEVKQLKNNIYNCFHNLWRNIPAEERLWATYDGEKASLRGSGYSSSFLIFNKKATNDFRDRKVLAYCVNLFMNVGHKIFYQQHGVQIDEEMFALSTMVQWIWRSAIRDGQEIELYVPSRRMREILKDWIRTTMGAVEISDRDIAKPLVNKVQRNVPGYLKRRRKNTA